MEIRAVTGLAEETYATPINFLISEMRWEEGTF